MRKILCVLLVAVMVLAMGVTSFAGEGTKVSDSFRTYTELREEGVLGDNITYEYWVKLNARAAKLEKELERSSQLKKVYDSNMFSISSSYSMKAGDIFVTNATSSFGLTGHAGIAISSSRILHIAGPGEHPTTLSLYSWNNDYTDNGWTKVYRHTNSYVASDAADWAEDTYRYSNADYVIDMNLSSTHETYCSKIVWQAYYYGPSSHNANGPTWGVRLPYDLDITIHDVELEETLN